MQNIKFVLQDDFKDMLKILLEEKLWRRRAASTLLLWVLMLAIFTVA